MAIRLQWQEPTNDDILTIEISRATTKYGSYSVIEAGIDATSDGNAKTAANTWVTSYIDSSGTATNWYKLRFWDDVQATWSGFSEPITGAQDIKLCSISDVQAVIDTVGRFSDDEIFNAIDDVEEMIYMHAGTPIAAMWSPIDKVDDTFQTTYYLGEEDIYRVDRVFVGTASAHEIFLDDGYKTNLQYGMVRLLTVASGGPSIDTDQTIEVRYVPKLYHRLAIYAACEYLLEKVDYKNRGEASRELEIIRNRKEMISSIINERIGLRLSSDYAHYEPVYGTNKKKVIQNHDRNRYLGSYGWD